ncbi:MAG: hypothetical protein Q8869_02080 [Candidatus Phytoplasma australasiaticum]|nr:hypothetical protein [Candidatus Phytoplasma australasiaticum]
MVFYHLSIISFLFIDFIILTKMKIIKIFKEKIPIFSQVKPKII